MQWNVFPKDPGIVPDVQLVFPLALLPLTALTVLYLDWPMSAAKKVGRRNRINHNGIQSNLHVANFGEACLSFCIEELAFCFDPTTAQTMTVFLTAAATPSSKQWHTQTHTIHRTNLCITVVTITNTTTTYLHSTINKLYYVQHTHTIQGKHKKRSIVLNNHDCVCSNLSWKRCSNII